MWYRWFWSMLFSGDQFTGVTKLMLCLMGYLL